MKNGIVIILCTTILCACSGSGNSSGTESAVTQSNAKSLTSIAYKQAVGTNTTNQFVNKPPAASSAKASPQAGITIEQTAGGSTQVSTCPFQSKSSPQAGITIEQTVNNTDISYTDCNASSSSSGTGITIKNSIADLNIIYCSTGSANFSSTDNNNNGSFDLGDTGTIAYSDCKLTNNLIFDGTQSITVESLQPNLKTRHNNTNFSIKASNGQTITYNGSITINAQELTASQTFATEYSNFQSTVGTLSSTIHSGTVTTTFANQGYELNQNTVVSSSLNAGQFTLTTPTALSGQMSNGAMQPPSAGILRITASNGSYVEINANDGDISTFTMSILDGTSTTTQTGQKWTDLN